MSLMTIDLTQSRVRKEEGIITVGKNKSVWLFTISIKDGHSISFGATSPDQFDDWFQTIFKITETHFKLVLFFFLLLFNFDLFLILLIKIMIKIK